MTRMTMLITAGLLIAISTAKANTYSYAVSCNQSYFKQGNLNEDITHGTSMPMQCDRANLIFLKSGIVLFQLVTFQSGVKDSEPRSMAFGGSDWTLAAKSSFANLNVERVYPPPSSDVAKLEQATGACIFDSASPVDVTNVSCTTNSFTEVQRFIYHVSVQVTGAGKLITDDGVLPRPMQAPAHNPQQSGVTPQTCARIVETHGFLSTAQMTCGFNYYSSQLMQDARSCSNIQTKDIWMAEDKKGITLFYDGEDKHGHSAMCQDVLRDFPSFVAK